MAHIPQKLVENALFYTGFTMLASAFFKTRALWCALMHSATKYLGGHSDILAGALIGMLIGYIFATLTIRINSLLTKENADK